MEKDALARRTSIPARSSALTSSAARPGSLPGTITTRRMPPCVRRATAWRRKARKSRTRSRRVRRRRLDRRERGDEVLRDAVAQGDERAVGAAPEHAAVTAAVGLERHADRAVERWPGVVVARVEQVVHVARVVQPAVAVECGRVRAAEQIEPLSRIADDVRVDGARRGREEVGRDVAVQVGRDHRVPLEHHPHDPLRPRAASRR